MAGQEFLASYGVQIDEAGVARLQAILEGNRDLAEKLSGAFEGANTAVDGLLKRASETSVSSAVDDSALARLAKQYYGLSRLNRAGSVSEAGGGYTAEGVRGKVQEMISGSLTDAPDSSLMNYLLRGSEITWAGMASGDTKNYVSGNSAGRPSLSDWGLTGDEGWLIEVRERANEIMREPLQQARKIMKEAAEAEARGEDTQPDLDRIEEILREPLEKVKELYREIDFSEFDDTGQSWEEELGEIDSKWTALVQKMQEPIALDVNTNDVESEAWNAYDAIRRILSNPIYANIQAAAPTGLNAGGSTFLRMSSGGRFTQPTSVQVAEDGDAEYIIPVKKESKAVPLLRQLLGELSPAARESLASGSAGGASLLGGGLSAALPAGGEIRQDNRTISAPVNINVNANGADGKQIGETIYDTAERYLVRTLQGAMG